MRNISFRDRVLKYGGGLLKRWRYNLFVLILLLYAVIIVTPAMPESICYVGQSAAAVQADNTTQDVWAFRFGGAGTDTVSAMQPTTDGGFVVVGDTSSYKEGKDWKLDAVDESNIWVVRVDAHGAPLWQRVYGGAKADHAHAVLATADGGFLVAGSTKSFGAGDFDAWLLKLDRNGEVEWQKTYGGAVRDDARALLLMADNAYLVVGNTQSFHPLFKNQKHPSFAQDAFWAFKIDSRGEIIWQRSYGGAAYATIAVPAEDNRFIIGGNLGKVGRNPFGGWLVKIDGATGAPVSDERGEVWSYSYGRYNVSIEGVQPNDAGYLTSERRFYRHGEDNWIAQLDKNGSVVWSSSVRIKKGSSIFGSSLSDFRSFAIAPTTGGTFLLAAETIKNHGYFGFGAKAKTFVAKLDAERTVVWERETSIYSYFNDILGQQSIFVQALAGDAYVVARSVEAKKASQDFSLLKLTETNVKDSCLTDSSETLKLRDYKLSARPTGPVLSVVTQAEPKPSSGFTRPTDAVFVPTCPP